MMPRGDARSGAGTRCRSRDGKASGARRRRTAPRCTATSPPSESRPRGTPSRAAPGAAGGASWSPAAYSPRTGLIYVAAMHMPMRYTVRERPAQGDRPAQRYTVTEPTVEPRWGTLTALDARTGKIRWQHRTAEPLVGGVLATAGGLVFMG